MGMLRNIRQGIRKKREDFREGRRQKVKSKADMTKKRNQELAKDVKLKKELDKQRQREAKLKAERRKGGVGEKVAKKLKETGERVRESNAPGGNRDVSIGSSKPGGVFAQQDSLSPGKTKAGKKRKSVFER